MTNSALLITPDHNFEATIVEFPTTTSHLAWFYEHLDCSCITCVTPMPRSLLDMIARRHEVRLDCWGDDEGLLIHEPVLNQTITLLTGYPGPLVGNWIIAANDGMGETIPLPPAVIKDLIKYLPLIPSRTSVD